jgi:hypothetical protein
MASVAEAAPGILHQSEDDLQPDPDDVCRDHAAEIEEIWQSIRTTGWQSSHREALEKLFATVPEEDLPEPPPSTEPPEPPSTGSGDNTDSSPTARDRPLKIGMVSEEQLPDTDDGLLAVLDRPRSLLHAIGALDRLGQLHGRDASEDQSHQDFGDFHPAIIEAGVGTDAMAIRSFAMHAVPLRRALGRAYQVQTPDVAMLVDLTVLAYWRCLQAERAAIVLLGACLEKPEYLDRVPKLERVKDLAVRQLTRLLWALRMLTGRRVPLDPEADAVHVLRFPAPL